MSPCSLRSPRGGALPGACIIALSLLSWACEARGDPKGETAGAAIEWVELVDNEAWLATPAERDPFAAHRPVSFSCEEFVGWSVGDMGELDVEMLACGYLALEQPALVDVPAGGNLELSLFHFDLSAPEASTAHLALVVGEDLIWERELDIPGGGLAAPSAVYLERIELERAIALGSPVYLHMHNHGQNSYVFVHLWAATGSP